MREVNKVSASSAKSGVYENPRKQVSLKGSRLLEDAEII